jgi:translation elongation factor EF-Tu-like GTPase
MTSPHRVRIGVLGHVDHGKTTLTAAIGKTLRDTYPTLNRPSGKDAWVLRGVEYHTPARRYLHVDPSPFGDRRASLLRATPLDGAVLVVSAVEGVMAQTRQDILGARWLGVPALVVALNKADQATDDLVSAVATEIRDELARYAYPVDETPIIPVSAFHALYGDREWTSRMLELMGAVDEHVPNPSGHDNTKDAKAHTRFAAELYAATPSEGGSVRPLWTGATRRIDLRAGEGLGEITLDDTEMALPGDTAHAHVRLAEPIPVQAGDPFVVTQPGLAAYAWGRVTEVLG